MKKESLPIVSPPCTRKFLCEVGVNVRFSENLSDNLRPPSLDIGIDLEGEAGVYKSSLTIQRPILKYWHLNLTLFFNQLLNYSLRLEKAVAVGNKLWFSFRQLKHLVEVRIITFIAPSDRVQTLVCTRVTCITSPSTTLNFNLT